MKQKTKAKPIFPKQKENEHYFFGYYGKSPWSKDGKYVLGLRVGFIDRHPEPEDKAEIMLKNTETGEIRKIAETKAWNWQQGCMLQWLGPDFNSKIIFNDRKNTKGKDRFISRIIDIKTGKEKIIDYPIYDISADGKKALGISFSRLQELRAGYGYPGIKNEKSLDEKVPENEGVYLINLEKNNSELIVFLKELYDYKHLSSMENGKHWIDQPVFSPDGKRFCFLHRWELEKGGLFHSRFFTSDLNGENLHMFPDSGYYSHFCWKNSKEILMFCSISEAFGKVRKGDKKSKFLLDIIMPIYRKIVPRSIRKRALPVGYYLLKDKTKETKKINIYHEDGHPSFSPDERYIVTDTYPDSKGYRKLILYDWKKQKSKILGRFYSIPDKKYFTKKINDFGNSSFRVDLHPRWNFQGNKICFDSVHEGKRDCYVIELD